MFCESAQANSCPQFFARIFHDSADELTPSLREAVRFLTAGVLQQQDFFDGGASSESRLSSEDRKWLQKSIDSFLLKNAGKPISEAFQVFDNISDRRRGQLISGNFKNQTIRPVKFEDVEGVALVDGFHESENCIYLRMIDTDFTALKSRRYGSSEPAFYDLAAEARLAKRFVNIHAVHSGNSPATGAYVLVSLSIADEQAFDLASG